MIFNILRCYSNRIKMSHISILNRSTIRKSQEYLNIFQISQITKQKKSISRFQNKHFKSFSTINLDKDYYKILEITPAASDKEIKEAYINLVKKYHPDVTGGASTEHFKEISNSFKILSDKNMKNFYDRNSFKVTQYNYSTNMHSSNDKHGSNSDYTNFSNQEEFRRNSNKEYFYSRYSRPNKEKFYNQNYRRSYYDNMNEYSYNNSYHKRSKFFYYKSFISEFIIYIPKLCFYLGLYCLFVLIKSKTKNEYHLFSD